MVVAEVWPGNVPMKVLGLQIEREHVCQQPIERASDVADGVRLEVSRGFERGDPRDFGITSSHMWSPLRRGRSGTSIGAQVVLTQAEVKRLHSAQDGISALPVPRAR